jgi:hypothetical protein
MLIPLVVHKNLKHSTYFHQFTCEVLIETLDKCEFTLNIVQLVEFMIVNSSRTESDQIINAFIDNKNEFNTYSVMLITSVRDYLSESHFVTILNKIERMKEGMLKIDEIHLCDFLGVCADKTFQSTEILHRFIILILTQNVSLFNNVSRHHRLLLLPIFTFANSGSI